MRPSTAIFRVSVCLYPHQWIEWVSKRKQRIRMGLAGPEMKRSLLLWIISTSFADSAHSTQNSTNEILTVGCKAVLVCPVPEGCLAPLGRITFENDQICISKEVHLCLAKFSQICCIISVNGTLLGICASLTACTIVLIKQVSSS